MADTTFRSIAIALAAGAAGTAAMTLSEALEQRLTDRRRPRTAASVAENVTGADAGTGEGRETTSSSLHWVYGTGLGAALLPLEGVSEPYRSLTFLGGVYGAGLALESLADTDEAPSKGTTAEFGADFVHHLVYAGATMLAYNGLKAALAGDPSEGAISVRRRFGSGSTSSAVPGEASHSGAGGTTVPAGSVSPSASIAPASSVASS